MMDDAGRILIMWSSQKLKSVVKSDMAAETLIHVDGAESKLWQTKLYQDYLKC